MPINALLSDAISKRQATARHVLELLFRTIRFLGSKGIPFRGDTTRDGNLYEMILERTYDQPKEQEWIKGRDNWMYNTIQNEIIQQFSHAVQRAIVAHSSESTFYGLMADGTTDESTTEQFSCSIQFVDNSLQLLNIPMERLVAYCFDGASNMSGYISGVQARLKELCPQSMWCVRAIAISRILTSYSALLATLTALKDDKGTRGDTRSKIVGLCKQARNGRALFGLLSCQALFEPCEAVARRLQSSNITALSALECANVLKQRIAALQRDENVEKMREKVNVYAATNDLRMPNTTARESRTPAHLRQTTEPEALGPNASILTWTREFYQAVDLVSSELERRFNQDTMMLAANRERAVIVAACGAPVDLDTLQLPKELDTGRLYLQLKMMHSVTGESSAPR
ncbi:hypothetical protein N1851_020466 [Merluccius polli]|uniref:DUF4371 domain-containing protein n=1 Tax=Merluccius polli TaxID=89951 RepID=A0AA47MK81_MERPO|nr:hypothetical protein N1851_020466 [Merluccius polli]